MKTGWDNFWECSWVWIFNSVLAEMRDVLYRHLCMSFWGNSDWFLGHNCVYLPVDVFLSDGPIQFMLNVLCSFNTDDTAADSPLSQQPLIYIALSFNLPFSIKLAITAPPSTFFFFFILQNWRFKLILPHFYICFWVRCSFKTHQSLLSLLFVLLLLYTPLIRDSKVIYQKVQ